MEENVLKRILPHSLEAEQSVIGSMLMDRDAIAAASEALAGEDFYNKQYGILFDTICELNDSGSAVDLVTLQERLRMKEVPPEVSGLEFIREILTAPITSANIKQYVKIVSEKSTLRKLIRLNEEIANTCYSGKETLEYILEDTEKRIFQLVQRRSTDAYVPIRQVVMNPKDYTTLYQRATQYYNLSMYDEALVDIIKALDYTPEKEKELRIDEYSMLTDIYIQTKEYDKALSAVNNALALSPKDYALLYKKGNVALYLNRPLNERKTPTSLLPQCNVLRVAVRRHSSEWQGQT